jgi:hypothetical protein
MSNQKVRKGEELPELPLKKYLKEINLINSIESDLQVEQFTHGYSNLTYLLKIENRGTGYLVLFALEKFELEGTKVSYGGKPLFVALQANDDKEKFRWNKEREKGQNNVLAQKFRGEASWDH